MTIYDEFRRHFSEENLTRIFYERVIYSSATGIDNLNQKSFKKQSKQHIEVISRKVITGNYDFTKYKLKLISKGRKKVPREISIPTVRDRIAIRALCDFLKDRFRPSLNPKLPQNIVSLVKIVLVSKRYSGCIKLDVSDFYPSIVHEELMSRLRRRIKNHVILKLVASSLSTPTVIKSTKSDLLSEIGVPQGLAISNVLAEIYLINIDKYMTDKKHLSYFRYVDDVIIFCDLEEATVIAKDIIQKFKKIGLTVHDPVKAPEKSAIMDITSQFDYLGYRFHHELISARPATIDKLRSSIVSIFTAYKHSETKNPNYLTWRLNLRITGCIFENKSKGWIFFFSEINDESLLHSLDHFVKGLSKRFDVEIETKSFVRSFKEITHRKYVTRYIPNFDEYERDRQEDVLSEYFGLDIKSMSNDEINFEFHKRIGKQVRDLQEDIKDFHY